MGVARDVVRGVQRVQGCVWGAHDVDQLVVLRLRPGRLLMPLRARLVVPLSRQQRLSSADNHVHERVTGKASEELTGMKVWWWGIWWLYGKVVPFQIRRGMFRRLRKIAVARYIRRFYGKVIKLLSYIVSITKAAYIYLTRLSIYVLVELNIEYQR